MASKNSKLGPITSLDTPWKDHTHYEVEQFLKDQLEQLAGDSSRAKMSIVVTDGNVKSYLKDTSSVIYKYTVHYTRGGNAVNSCKMKITIGGVVVFDGDIVAGQEVESPDLAYWLNLAAEDATYVNMKAYDLDDQDTEIISETSRITYTRQVANVQSQVALGATMTVGSSLRHYVEFTGSQATLCARFYQKNGTTPLMNGELDHFEYTVYNPGNTDVIIVPSGLDAGAHKVEAWLVLNDVTKTQSAIATSTIITTEGATDGTIFVVAQTPTKAVINDYVDIPFAVSIFRDILPETTEYLPVVLQENDGVKWVTKAIRSAGSGITQHWNYLVKNETSNLCIGVPRLNADGSVYYNAEGNVEIRSDAVLYLSFSATRSVVSWTQETAGLLMYLTAQNKSNSDYDIGVWKDNGYEMEFEDVQWNSNGSGWSDIPLDDNGVAIQVSDMASYTGRKSTALHLIGTSRARIKNFYPLFNNTTVFEQGKTGGGILGTGRTMKMSFMVSNVSNAEEKVISCWDETNKTGFYVTGNSIYINIGKELISLPAEAQNKAGHNERHFSADRRIDLTITIQPYYYNGAETKHEIRYYVNGEIAGFDVLTNESLSQMVATPIQFGGNGATLDLFDFRCYNGALGAFEVIQTRTMDLDSSVEINNTFTKNNFYTITNGVPVITLAKAIEYGKYQAKIGNTRFAVWITTNLCNGEAYIGNTKTHSTRPEGFYVFRFKKNEAGEGIIDPDLTFYIEATGIKASDQESYLRLRRQGTSTAKEAKGNIRVDVRNTCIIHKFNAATQQFYADTEPNRTAGYVYTVGKKARIWQIPDADAIPCYLLTCKKNPNESTQARNLPTARWYEDCCRHLAKQTDANGNHPYADCMTEPQRRELNTILENTSLEWSEAIDAVKTRQTVDGIPSLGFEIEYDSPAALNPIQAVTSFGGQFDMITDKTNMEVFGFGGYNSFVDEHNRQFNEWGDADEDFSIEWRRNDSLICNFLTADLQALDGDEDNNPLALDLEYRYPEPNGSSLVISWSSGKTPTPGMEQGGVMQRLFDFVRTCAQGDTKTAGVVYTDGVAIPQTGIHAGQIPIYVKAGEKLWTATIKDNKITWTSEIAVNDATIWRTDDNAARLAKFKTEANHYLVVNQFLFNGLAIDSALMVDQDTKNQFFTYFTGEKTPFGEKLLRLLGYDFDSSWGIDNDNFFRFDYTVKYSDGLYDGAAEFTYSNGTKAILGPEIWKLIFACYAEEIATMKGILYSGFLSKSAILKYMHEDQVDIYNSLIYNANSEYSYTSKASDYQKTHGSAREHTEWFVEGRMHFISGQNFVGARDQQADFFKNAAAFNLTTFSSEFASQYPNNAANRGGTGKEWTLEVTAYERTSASLAYGASTYYPAVEVEVTQAYDANYQPVGNPTREIAYLKASSDVGDAPSDNRFRIFGGKHLKTITGLSSWYILNVADWGDLTNVEELEIGSTKSWTDEEGNVEYYRNPNLNNLGIGPNSKPFGACKKLNLAGCVALTGRLDLVKFPVLEDFEGIRMDGITEVQLPVGNSLKRASYPANLTTVTIDNKPNLSEVTFEGVGAVTNVAVINSSAYIAQLAITKFL